MPSAPRTFLVEALSGFVAEPAALHNLVEYSREICLCVTPCGKVRRNVRQDVDAHHVGEAEGAGARPADGRTGQRIDFFDGEPLLQHQVGGVEHDRDADAVGDEVGRVVRETTCLPSMRSANAEKAATSVGIGFRGGITSPGAYSAAD